MVHALEEIRRVLTPGGILIDLRPVADSWPVEIITGSAAQKVGQVVDLPAQLADDAASEEAFAQADKRGLFNLERTDCFDFVYVWDTPDEMRVYIADQWEEYIALPEEVLANARRTLQECGTGSRVGLRVKMHIARWRKI